MIRPNSLILLKKALHLSFSNLYRNKFLSIATISVMGIILFIFNIILAVNFIAENSLQNLSSKVDLTLYLKESASITQSQQLLNEVKLLDGVTDATYTSKEEALDKIKSAYPNIYESFEKYDLQNPLPASISIKTISPDFHQQIENFIKGSQFSTLISNIEEEAGEGAQEKSIISSVAKNLKKVTDFSHQIIFWLVIIFVIGGTLIMASAIQLTIFTRRREINVMRLVGSTIGFIHLPFIIEAILYAILAMVVNFILLILISNQIDIEGTTLATFSANLNITALVIAELSITIILAICASILSVHKYLKSPLATEE